MNDLAKGFYEFDRFRLDPSKRLLLANGEVVPLTSKAFDTLLVLVENSGQVLRKDYLMKRVWPDTVVEENNLTQSISLLRRVLGESPEDHQFIVTIPGVGYRFVASVNQIRNEYAALLAREDKRSNGLIEAESATAAVDTAGPRMKSEEPGGKTLVGSSGKPAGDVNFKSRRIKNRFLFAIVLVTVVVGVFLGVQRFFMQGPFTLRREEPFSKMKITRLTYNSRAVDAAIAPDGKYVVHVLDEASLQGLWVQQVATSSNLQIVLPAEVEYLGLTFSHDSNYIYFVARERDKAEATLYQISALGGQARKVMDNSDSAITLSPDSTRFAFVRLHSSRGESHLMVASSEATDEQKLAIRRQPAFFPMYPSGPDWSPDGKIIACAAGNFGTRFSTMSVVGVRVEDGVEKPISSQKWFDVGRVAWVRDGSGLIMTARDQISSPRQIWLLPGSVGTAKRITNDLSDYSGISMTADSTSLVSVQSGILSNLWVAPAGDASKGKAITSIAGNFFGGGGISWTPDGRLVYQSNSGKNLDLWIIDTKGGSPKQLTINSGSNMHPSVSPDGRTVVFASNRQVSFNLWKMDIDGSNPKQLTRGSGEAFPQYSPDGEWVVYQQGYGTVKATVWKTPIDGSNPVQLTEKYSIQPVISPDQKLVAYYQMDPQTNRWGVEVIPFEGGRSVKGLNIRPTVGARVIQWTPDGKALAYIQNRGGVSNIWYQLLSGGPPRQLTEFDADRIFFFDWSRGGKQLAFARGIETNDVVLISNFR